ncbi:hypothetical protein MASR2M117_07830 [Paludibacter sp.]
MKKFFFLIFISLYFNSVCTITSANYINNQSPLIEAPFIALPIGSVKAEGWLYNQLMLQKNGLTGHAETLYNHKNDLGPDCDWLGGTGDSWERAPYYTKGLVALAYVLDDAELKTKAQKWVDWSLNNQRRNGYFGPQNNNDWWARMPMLYAIRDYYDATGDSRVIPFFTKYFQYQNANIESQPLSSWGKSRAGDNIDIVFWLYNRTGDAFLLELADKLHNQAYPWTNIFTNNLFNQFLRDFQPKHNVNVPQAMKMPVVYYQKSKATADKEAYVKGREHLMCDHGQPFGMQSGCEMLAGRSSMTGLELCSVVEQMQTSEISQMILGDATIGDQLEMVAYNALPGGLSYDIKGLQYYQQANQVISKHGYTGMAQNYDNGNMPGPFSGYGCCRFDFHMGYPYFVKTMWAATSDNGLAIMAYGPSKVTAKVADGAEVTIKETTNYPFNERISLSVTLAKKTLFPLKLRIPAWCNAPEIKVNGKAQTGIIKGEFYTINRSWSNNDEVSIYLPMDLIVDEEVNNSISIHRGPLVFSLKIEEDWRAKNDYGNGFKENEVLPLSAWNYALVIDKNNPSNTIQVVENQMPDLPYNQTTTPVQLKVSAKKLNSWVYAHNGRLAIDPPFSPVESNFRDEQVTLIPYGAQTLRVTCFPYIGDKKMISSTFTENFDNGQKGWVQYGGSWYVKDGEYFAGGVEASHPCSKSVYTQTSFDDFTYEAKVQLINNQGDAGVIFRATRLGYSPDDYDGYYVGLNSANDKVVFGKANGSWNPIKEVDKTLDINQWYNVKIVANKSNFSVYVDDMNKPVMEVNDASFATGSIGVRAWNVIAKWDDINVKSLNESGINTKKYKKGLTVYPNPTSDLLSVEVPENGKIKIYNLAGRQLYNSNVTLGLNHISTYHYNDGVYFVQYENERGISYAQFRKKHV